MHIKCRLYGHTIEEGRCAYCNQGVMSLVEMLFHYRSLIKADKKQEAILFLQASAPSVVRLAIIDSVNEDGRFITGNGQIFTNFGNNNKPSSSK